MRISVAKELSTLKTADRAPWLPRNRFQPPRSTEILDPAAATNASSGGNARNFSAAAASTAPNSYFLTETIHFTR